MAKLKKHPTKFPGVRFYESDKRPKCNGKPDRYFSVRYRLDGKLKEEGLGWLSEGWTADKANQERAKLTTARATGEGPRTLAKKKQIQQQKEAEARVEEERQQRIRMTFGEAWEVYKHQAKANKSARSFKREDALYRLWIKPVIGKLPLVDVRPLHLEKIKRTMFKEDRSAASVRYAFAVVRQVFNHCIKNSMFDGDNPTAQVQFPKQDNRRIRFLSTDEAKNLLQELEAREQRVYQMALLSLDCGLRRGEIFNLTWGDIDLNRKTLTLRDTKNNRNRTAYLTTRTADMLFSMEWQEPNVPVFPGTQSAKIKAISKRFLASVKSLGLNDGIDDPRQKVVFHTLRHTYASRLVENGVSLYTVKELMGHCTITMTERYAHLADNTLKGTVDILDRLNASEGNGQVAVAK